MVVFKHKITKKRVEVTNMNRVWMFLFGGFYLMYKRLWKQVLIFLSPLILSFIIALMYPEVIDQPDDSPFWMGINLATLGLLVYYIVVIKDLIIHKLSNDECYERIKEEE